MSESSAPSALVGQSLGTALEFLDKVDRDLAELQTDEAIMWRAGTVVLLIGAFAFGGITALAILVPLVRRLLKVRPQSDENAADSPVVVEPIFEVALRDRLPLRDGGG
jgi:hypothetical protein